MDPRHPARSGQIALIALLAVVVMMTIGISLYSRSTLDVSLSRQQDESARVYQAAESGVETALGLDFTQITGETQSTIQVGNTAVTYKITPQSGITTRIEEGESIQIRTDSTAASKPLVLTWGKGTTCPALGSTPSDTSPPPLLVRVYNQSGVTYSAKNYAFSPCTYTANDFSKNVTGDATNGYTTTMNLTTTDVRVSIQPMVASTDITISGSGWLPVQFHTIVAIASSSATTANRESAAMQVTRSVPQWPSFMDYVLYSGTTIVK